MATFCTRKKRKALFEAELNDRLAPRAMEQPVSEAPPWQPGHQRSWTQRWNVTILIITSVLFCFLLIPHYCLTQVHVRGTLGTVTTQQAEAADANKGGREIQAFKWEKNLSQFHLLILCNEEKLKNCCWRCQLLTLTAQLQDIVLEFMLLLNFRFHLFFFPFPVILRCIYLPWCLATLERCVPVVNKNREYGDNVKWFLQIWTSQKV